VAGEKIAVNVIMIAILSRSAPLVWAAMVAGWWLAPLRLVIVLAALAISGTLAGAIKAGNDQRHDETIDLLLRALLATRPRGRTALRVVR
jgi:hypothetical protein